MSHLSNRSILEKADLALADLTAGGVKAVRPTVRTANWDHQFVNKAINEALKQASLQSADGNAQRANQLLASG